MWIAFRFNRILSGLDDYYRCACKTHWQYKICWQKWFVLYLRASCLFLMRYFNWFVNNIFITLYSSILDSDNPKIDHLYVFHLVKWHSLLNWISAIETYNEMMHIPYSNVDAVPLIHHPCNNKPSSLGTCEWPHSVCHATRWDQGYPTSIVAAPYNRMPRVKFIQALMATVYFIPREYTSTYATMFGEGVGSRAESTVWLK